MYLNNKDTAATRNIFLEKVRLMKSSLPNPWWFIGIIWRELDLSIVISTL